MPVSLDSDPAWLLQDAVGHAVHFQIAIYDAVYLALAQTTRIRFVTADKKLSDLVSAQLPFVHYLGDFPVP